VSRHKRAPAIFVNPLVDAHPHELRAMRQRAGTQHMREVHRRLREAGASVDNAVAQACDAVESALAENPHDRDLQMLKKSLHRYQAAVAEAAELVGVGDDDTDDDDVTDDDTDDDDVTDDDTDDDDVTDDDTARESRSLRERRPRVKIEWRAV
jgi:hypothetical protein